MSLWSTKAALTEPEQLLLENVSALFSTKKQEIAAKVV
jgi:hypothetical protein